MAKGPKVSCCRAQLPTPGFHGYLRLPSGLRSRGSGPEAGLGVWRLGCLCSPTGPSPGSRAPGMAWPAQQGGSAQSRGGRGPRGEKLRARPSVSQLKSLPGLSPQEGLGDSVLSESQGSGGKAGEGPHPSPTPSVPRAAGLLGHSVPSVLSRPPGTEGLGRPDLTPRVGCGVTAEHSRTSPSGHWRR